MAQVASLAGTLVATTQPWFFKHSSYAAFEQMGYATRGTASNCAIVLYGDSTALAGLDSKLIEARTGAKTCNISEARPVEDFVGVNYPLDQYLARNPPPDFIVTAWTPNDLNLDRREHFEFSVDGLGYALQFDRSPWLWKQMLAHPYSTAKFLLWAQNSVITDELARMFQPGYATERKRSVSKRDDDAGVWHYPTAPQRSCTPKTKYARTEHDSNAASVASFRKRYSSKGIRVVVDVTPVAKCDEDLSTYPAMVANLTDNELEVLPISSFNAENIHLTPLASLAFSEKVAKQILDLKAQGQAPQ